MSATAYHKTATRDVRPFFGIASLEHALQSAQIRLYDQQPFTDATSFTVEPQDAQKLKILLRPNLQESALEAAAIPRSKLVLAITACNPFLKKSHVVDSAVLNRKAPEEVAIGSEILEQLGGGSLLTVEIALCLRKEMPRRPGNPFLPGHWISKKSFEIRPAKLAEDFDVQPLDDEGWKARGLPPKTLYYVDYFGFINEPVSKDKSIAKVYVHSDVYRKLSVESSQKIAKPLMAFLAAEISCQLLTASLSDWDMVEKPEPRSPLSAFLRRVSRARTCTLDELRTMAREPGATRLRAILHADQQSVRTIAES